MNDSKAYLERKKSFAKLITLYGRNVVLEALQDESITPKILHLSNSNQAIDTIISIETLAKKRNVLIKRHEKKALSRISKNASQDQGVALDIESKSYLSVEDYLDTLPNHAKVIALDGITNPQNLGMIIRSIAASKVDAILLPKNSSAKISPLVIKASAGTLFKAKIVFCDTLKDVLPQFSALGFQHLMLSSHATTSLFELDRIPRSLFVLGNESDGVSQEVQKLCDTQIAIPMQNGVESLNVAVTAALIAFMQN